MADSEQCHPPAAHESGADLEGKPETEQERRQRRIAIVWLACIVAATYIAWMIGMALIYFYGGL